MNLLDITAYNDGGNLPATGSGLPLWLVGIGATIIIIGTVLKAIHDNR